MRDTVTAMTTPTFAIAPDDLPTALAYVQRKLATEPLWLDHSEAEQQWQSARRDTVTLSHWCERWLTPDQRRQLQAALRAARKRRRDRTGTRDPAVNVTLSRPAWRILKDLAHQQGLTLSDWLIARHRDEWLQM
jgi:macrodomain Ter protein organizer (MatP/YcbG family)